MWIKTRTGLRLLVICAVVISVAVGLSVGLTLDLGPLWTAVLGMGIAALFIVPEVVRVVRHQLRGERAYNRRSDNEGS